LARLPNTTLELPYFKERTISSITIEGNNLVSSETILSKVPYAVGDTFRAFKSAEMIQLLFALDTLKIFSFLQKILQNLRSIFSLSLMKKSV